MELAPLRDHELAAATVAVAVGVQPSAGSDALESVVTRLRTLEGLLVLDNLEHLPGAHRLVDRLHRETRRLRVLVTSREPMRIEGEQQFLVQPLEVPDAATESDLDALAAVDSVRLFLDRARAHDPTQALDAANAHDIAEIVRRLDGLPLALEIAAPWMRLLTPGGLLERLAAPLDVSARRVDAPVRHRTLRDTITWSYELLPDEERELLRAVAVFAGSFTLEAAERVVPGVGMPARVDVAEGLFDLVDRHLVQPADPVAGRPRFRLLETIRSFAADELARQPPGELDALRTAHADWVAAWAARLAAHSEGPDSPQWLAEAVAEADNIRAAVHTYRRFGRSHDWLQLVVDAMTLWFEAGHEQEGEDYLSAALDAAGAEAPARAIGLTYWAWLRGTHNRREAAAAAVDALGLARRDDDPLVEAFAQQTLGDSLDDPDAAEAASLAVFEAADRSEGRPVRYGPTGPDAVRCGASYNLSARWLHRDLPQALTWQQEALRRAEREGDRRITAVNAARLAQALLLGGDTESARELLQRARELVSRMVTARWEDIVTYAEGLLAVHDGRTEDAELLLQRLFDSAVAAGRPLHTNLGAAALADLYTATDRPGEARSVLARARRAAAGAVDGTHLARLAVRRARLLRLDGLEDQAQSRLDAAAPALEPAALTPERVVWLVESAWLAAASGGP